VTEVLRAPFPAFGGKRDIASAVWERLGSPKQYIEPFCFSAAVLLAATAPASLEVIGDLNGFVANFWRAVVHQSDVVARWADYPVSHIDLGARHRWLMEQRERVGAGLQDPNWPGDAQVAGWWLWGQCCWIGSGWCEWQRKDSARRRRREGNPGERTDSARRKRRSDLLD
jgi:DNA adenine methylase